MHERVQPLKLEHLGRRGATAAEVVRDKPDERHAPPERDEVNAHTVLYGVLKHSGAELSAHQMLTDEQERWSSIAQLAAEFETIAAVAQRDRWVDVIRGSGLSQAQVEQLLNSDSFGPLTAELRRAEAHHHDVDVLLSDLVRRRTLDDAEDVGAVLISRLQKVASPRRGKRRRDPKLIAGLIPVADGPMTDEMAYALTDRAELIEARAVAMAERAVAEDAPWLKRLGVPPKDSRRLRWLHEIRTVAAYRDRYQEDGRTALGEPRTEAQKLDAARAEQAIRRARAIACDPDPAQDGHGRALDSAGRAIS